MQPLQRRVFDLRHNLTAYDAMYVALAEALNVPLLTDDAKFAGTPGHHAYADSTDNAADRLHSSAGL